MAYYGNPMCDFLYFVFTSVLPQEVVEHFDELVAFYHQELVAAMTSLKVQKAAPSLDQIVLQLQRAGPFGKKELIKFISFCYNASFPHHQPTSCSRTLSRTSSWTKWTPYC